MLILILANQVHQTPVVAAVAAQTSHKALEAMVDLELSSFVIVFQQWQHS
jgi:hypothetical protein